MIYCTEFDVELGTSGEIEIEEWCGQSSKSPVSEQQLPMPSHLFQILVLNTKTLFSATHNLFIAQQ